MMSEMTARGPIRTDRAGTGSPAASGRLGDRDRATGTFTRLPTSMELLAELSRLYKIQPATALWRAVELREVLAIGLPAGTGLDLGCGDGGLAGMILRHLDTVPELIGLDYSEGEIAVAERRGVYGRAICGRSDAMPITDASLDFVFSNSVLEHIPQLEETFSEISRVLKPGGSLIATAPAPGFHDLLRIGGRTGEARRAGLARMDERLAHVNYLDAAGWDALCARHGLQLDLAKPYLDRAQVRRWERLSAMTGGVLQAIGASNAMLYRLQRLTRSDDKTAGGLLSANSRPAGWSRIWARIVAGSVLRNGSSNGLTESEGACLLIRAVKP